MTISIDRSLCCDLNETLTREWLVTNGVGGYAAGTVAGVLTRKQHGLLIAKLSDECTPQLLLAKVDEEVSFDQRTYYLGTNEYQDGTFNPSGFVHLESFRLEEGFPVFTYRLGGIDGLFLEKRIWMCQGQNTTFIRYRVLRTTLTEHPGYKRSGITGALSFHKRDANTLTPPVQSQQRIMLTLLPLAAYRPYDQHQQGHYHQHYAVRVHHKTNHQTNNGSVSRETLHLPYGSAGCTIQPADNSQPYHLIATGHPDMHISFIPTGVWYWHFLHRQHTSHKQTVSDDFYLPGVIHASLWPGDESCLTLVISSEPLPQLPLHTDQLARIYQQSLQRQQHLTQHMLEPAQRYFGEGGEAAHAHHMRVIPLTISSRSSQTYEDGHKFLSLLLQAGDRFFIQQKTELYQKGDAWPAYCYSSTSDQANCLLTDYFGHTRYTRDILLALPGLLLITQRSQETRSVLRHLARYFRDGLLPNQVPTIHQSPNAQDYSSVDTTLWYFYALDYYLRATKHYEFLEEVFPLLQECIQHYIHGTAYGIGVDAADGLLAAGQSGKALTWMNAYVQGQPATPRTGKPVEVNALWYHTLSLMYEWAGTLNHRGNSGQDPLYYHQLCIRCKTHFEHRFWYQNGGYLYDVIDGAQGNDPSLRPNQLFALSLRHTVARSDQRTQILESVKRHLLTSYGLRTLAPWDAQYQGIDHRTDNLDRQQQALHQGSVWPWLIGPYIDALLTMPFPTTIEQEQLWHTGLQLLAPFYQRFTSGLLGMCENVLTGNSPHSSLSMVSTQASALSTAELLRCYHTLAQRRIAAPEALSIY